MGSGRLLTNCLCHIFLGAVDKCEINRKLWCKYQPHLPQSLMCDAKPTPVIPADIAWCSAVEYVLFMANSVRYTVKEEFHLFVKNI